MTINPQYMTNPAPQQGWQCPVCKAVFAPWVATCFNCKPTVRTTTNITVVNDANWNATYRDRIARAEKFIHETVSADNDRLLGKTKE